MSVCVCMLARIEMTGCSFYAAVGRIDGATKRLRDREGANE